MATEHPAAPTLATLDGVVVHYGRRLAVDQLSLRICGGERIALLGANGAGKTTTLLALTGGVAPSAGTVNVMGGEMAGRGRAATSVRHLAHVGFADQPPSLYEFLTVTEHVRFVAETRGLPDNSETTQVVAALLADLGIEPYAHRPCRELSFGLRQRVSLAAALVGPVKLLLLDESVNGLDPHAMKRALHAVMRQASAPDTALIFSTHMLELAEEICTRAIMMEDGKLIADMSRETWQLTYGNLRAAYVAHVADGKAREA
ncbi:MAG: ABC transporter ATP-binding protein [Myxococcales bacterium]|nr:ABC transporter ATP-binding protein [Myxococcales bacterium]